MLSFYDHDRQNYGHLPIEATAEFMVGDYGESDDGCGPGGEFKIELHRLGQPRRFGEPDKPLTPQLQVFSDAYGALREAVDAGLLDALERTAILKPDDLTALLLDLGFRDRSDFPVGSEPPACHCCGTPRDVIVQRRESVPVSSGLGSDQRRKR